MDNIGSWELSVREEAYVRDIRQHALLMRSMVGVCKEMSAQRAITCTPDLRPVEYSRARAALDRLHREMAPMAARIKRDDHRLFVERELIKTLGGDPEPLPTPLAFLDVET